MSATSLDTPAPKPRLKWVAGIGAILVGIGGLAAWAIASPGAVSYYATPSEVTVQGDDAVGRQLRLGGRVASLDREGVVVTFVVADETTTIPVTYSGEVPDTLKVDTDVIAEGTMTRDGTFVATNVLAKCSSKFVSVEDAEDHLGG